MMGYKAKKDPLRDCEGLAAHFTREPSTIIHDELHLHSLDDNGGSSSKWQCLGHSVEG